MHPARVVYRLFFHLRRRMEVLGRSDRRRTPCRRGLVTPTGVRRRGKVVSQSVPRVARRPLTSHGYPPTYAGIVAWSSGYEPDELPNCPTVLWGPVPTTRWLQPAYAAASRSGRI